MIGEMKCARCRTEILPGLDNLSMIRIDERNGYQRFCKSCHKGKAGVPDVYLGTTSGDVMYEENIADPETGNPIPFYDKASKAAAMKQANVREAGDRVHGSRNEDQLKRRTYI